MQIPRLLRRRLGALGQYVSSLREPSLVRRTATQHRVRRHVSCGSSESDGVSHGGDHSATVVYHP